MSKRNPGQVARRFSSRRKGWADLAIRHVSHSQAFAAATGITTTRGSDPELQNSLSSAQRCEMKIFRRQFHSFVIVLCARYNNVTPSLSLFFLFSSSLFQKAHTNNGRCVVVPFFFVADVSEVFVRISITILFSRVNRWSSGSNIPDSWLVRTKCLV